MGAPRVLVVDDEPEIRDLLSRYLEADGFDVVLSGDGDEALTMVSRISPEVVILDVGLPDRDGFAVLSELRRISQAAVIMLTARAEEVDRVVGLTLGADDYVTKPFSPRELTARIRAVLRRGPGKAGDGETAVVRIRGLEIDRLRREVTVDGMPTELTALEFDLLDALASHPGWVFTRQRLLERVWGDDYFGSDRVVDAHIANIRRTLGDAAAEPRFIATVRGVGYKFVAERS